MTFADALVALKNGKKVARPEWFFDDQVIYIKEATFNGFQPTLVQYNEHSGGDVDKYPGWIGDYEDMCANDWLVYH